MDLVIISDLQVFGFSFCVEALNFLASLGSLFDH